ncbi:MAG: DUF4407 domain-containing protein [Sphingobacteriales bacterium]|jgi:hypothetical protein|nr:MAG: DUF4407 domain-containing protein [Sphingobacteriales bacterium]
MKENNIEQTKNYSLFTRFFWFCSGANVDILKQCPHSEQNKYVGIGATVFFTGLLASISGGYALYTVFNRADAAIVFGIIWGLVIFNIDRFIVSTIRKEDKFWNEIKLVIPRIVLALILAIVIAKPLELKIFEKEIAQKIQEKQRLFAIDAQKKLTEQYSPLQDSLRKEIDAYKAELQKIQAQRDTLYKAFIGEAEGTSGTYKLGKGPVYKEKKEQYDKIEKELYAAKAEFQPLIDEREQQILALKSKRDDAYSKTQPTIENYDGLMARLDAQQQLPQLPSLFITLLFICIETAPIFTKLFSNKGPYDDMLRNIEHDIQLKSIENINQRNHELNQKLLLYTNIDKAKTEQEIANNQESMKIISEAQLELTKEIVEDWLKTEKEKLKHKNA